MRLLVFSDSHGDTRDMLTAISRYGPDGVIHLGDYVSDAQTLASAGTYALHWVGGNGDLWRACPDEMLLTLAGFTVLITHGHRYHVKNGYNEIRAAGARAGADIVLFGHTHRAHAERRSGRLLANPGAAGGKNPTCGLLTLAESGYDFIIQPIG